MKELVVVSCFVVLIFQSSVASAQRAFERPCRTAYPRFAYPEDPPPPAAVAARPFGGSNQAMLAFLRAAGVIRPNVESTVYQPLAEDVAVVEPVPVPKFGADFSQVKVWPIPATVKSEGTGAPVKPAVANVFIPAPVSVPEPVVAPAPVVEQPIVSVSSPFFRFIASDPAKVMMGVEAAVNFERADKVSAAEADRKEILAQMEKWKTSGKLPKPKGLRNLFARATRSDVFPLGAVLREKGIETPYDVVVMRSDNAGTVRLLTLVKPAEGNSFTDTGVARLTKSFQDFGFGTVVASPLRIDLNLKEADAKKGLPSLSQAIGTTLEGVNVSPTEVANARVEFHDELTHRVKFATFNSLFATALSEAPAEQAAIKRLREKFAADFSARDRVVSVTSVTEWIKANGGLFALTKALDHVRQFPPKVSLSVNSSVKVVIKGKEEGKLAVKGTLTVTPSIDTVSGEFAMPSSEWVSYSREGIKQGTAALSLELLPAQLDSPFDPSALRTLPTRVADALAR